jgi:hypothetical protein
MMTPEKMCHITTIHTLELATHGYQTPFEELEKLSIEDLLRNRDDLVADFREKHPRFKSSALVQWLADEEDRHRKYLTEIA